VVDEKWNLQIFENFRVPNMSCDITFNAKTPGLYNLEPRHVDGGSRPPDRARITYHLTNKSKALNRFQKFERLLEVLDNQHINVIRLSALPTGRLYPRKDFWYSFF
jgi:hypothetical protein